MSTDTDQEVRKRRIAFAGGVMLIAVVVFVSGYLIGNRQPAADSGAAMANSPPAAAMGEGEVKQAGSLDQLLPALEAKVATNPADIDQRVLLARTYAELGQRDKNLRTLRALRKDAPQNTEVVILLATALADGGDQKELREAYRVFDEAVRLKPAVAPMARLYQGEVLMKLGDGKGAVKLWKDHLRTMPAGDERRALFEQRIAAATR